MGCCQKTGFEGHDDRGICLTPAICTKTLSITYSATPNLIGLYLIPTAHLLRPTCKS